MSTRGFSYETKLIWTGNTGRGTADYAAYERRYEISAPGKPVIAGSSDPAFRGDAERYNPEELLVAALSACHMLWFLHLCSDAGISVLAYQDAAEGRMELDPSGGGRFTEVVLRPQVTLADEGRAPDLAALHVTAHQKCFIANSVNFPVTCEPVPVSEQR